MSDPISNLRTGDILVAADGSKHGCIVVDAARYASTGDVIVRSFTSFGIEENTELLDVFRLLYRFTLVVDNIPDWVPNEAKANHRIG